MCHRKQAKVNMLTASLAFPGVSQGCPFWDKDSPMHPSPPLWDACCANCGCLLYFQPLQPLQPPSRPRPSQPAQEKERWNCYEILPDTPEELAQAAAVV